MRQTAEVVDGDMGILPAHAACSARSVAVDAVTHPVDPTELLDIEVDQLSGGLALVAHDHRLRFENSSSREPVASQDPAKSRAGNPGQLRQGQSRQPMLAPQLDDELLSARGQLAGRSVGPRRAIEQARLPFHESRFNHFLAVWRLIPAARETWPMGQASSKTRRHTKARLSGQLLALLWTFIRAASVFGQLLDKVSLPQQSG